MSESLQKVDYADDEKGALSSGAVFVTLCAMLVVSTVAFGSVDVWAIGVNAVFAGLLLIFWTINAWVRREFQFNTSALQIPVLGLIVIGLIQLLPLRSAEFSTALLSTPATRSLSLAPYQTRLMIIQLVIFFIFFAAAQTFINNEERLRRIVVMIIAFGSVMAFFGILQQLASTDGIYGLRPSSQAMPFASFVNRHHFAAFMEMTVGLTLGLLFGKKAVKSDKRFFLLIAVVVMGIAIVLTSSRGGMLGLLAVIVFVVTINLRQKADDEPAADTEINTKWRGKIISIGGALLLILVLLGSVLLLGGDESLMRGIGMASADDVSNGRFHFWQIGWRVFLDHPILGAGFDAFGTVFPNYDSRNGMFRVEQAHNDYLQTLADSGILGFACVAAFIFLLFKKSRAVVGKNSDRFGRAATTGALAGCFGILIHSFFDFPLRTSSNMFFFLTLVVIATNLLAPRKVSRQRRIQ